MIPRELDGKTLWPVHKANIKLQEIRKECIAKLRARNVSFGIPENGNLIEEVLDRDGTPVKQINQVYAGLKHTGAEASDMFKLAWWEFCQEPQDSNLIDAPAVAKPKPRARIPKRPDNPEAVRNFLNQRAEMENPPPALTPAGMPKSGAKTQAERMARL